MPLPRNPTAQDFFKLYITDQIIDHIVVQSNLYAQQFIEQHQNNLRPHSLVHQWKATDRAENTNSVSSCYSYGSCPQTKICYVLVYRQPNLNANIQSNHI